MNCELILWKTLLSNARTCTQFNEQINCRQQLCLIQFTGSCIAIYRAHMKQHQIKRNAIRMHRGITNRCTAVYPIYIYMYMNSNSRILIHILTLYRLYQFQSSISSVVQHIRTLHSVIGPDECFQFRKCSLTIKSNAIKCKCEYCRQQQKYL